jgi:FAD-linked sulfhydryl oxidase
MYARAVDVPSINLRVASVTQGSSYDPASFGPALWFTLHNAATAYPDRPDFATQKKMQTLLTSLYLLIPCQLCRIHWNQTLAKSDLDLATASREALFAFLVHAHNMVNIVTKKPLMTLDQAKDVYGFNRPGGSSVRISYTL